MTRIISNAIRQQIDQETQRLRSVKNEIARQRAIMNSQRVVRRQGRENQLNRKRFNEDVGRFEGKVDKDIKRLRDLRKLPTIEERNAQLREELRTSKKREPVRVRDRFGNSIRLGEKVTTSFGAFTIPRDSRSIDAEIAGLLNPPKPTGIIFNDFRIKSSPFFIDDRSIARQNLQKSILDSAKFKMFGLEPNTRVHVRQQDRFDSLFFQ